MTPDEHAEEPAVGAVPLQVDLPQDEGLVSTVTHRTMMDWLWFWVLTLLWAISFPLTRVAVKLSNPSEGLPVQVVVAGRMTIAAIVLVVAALLSGQRFPPLRDYRRWGMLFLMGFVGMTLPFWLITYAQRTVDSSLAALYVATAPLFVAVMAHFSFKDERLTWQIARGLLVGFVGIALLFGPDAIGEFGSASMLAQLFCLLATSCYALEAILARAAPSMPSLIMSSGFVSFGAVFSWFGLIGVDWSAHQPVLSSWLAVVGLGIGPTALAALFYMVLIKRTNATFLALTGYTIPVVSALIGYLAFGEVQAWHSFLAFGLILLGVWVSQHTAAKEKRPA